MTRTWAELLGDEEPGDEDDEPKRRRFRRLRSGLSKSRRAITSGLTGWRYDPSDLDTWEQLEEVLIAADVGVQTAQEIVERLEKRRPKTNEDVLDGLAEVLAELASPGGGAACSPSTRGPPSILVVGVNGTGKTTTIGKLASRLRESGRSVIVAAADTYRAAADEQLEIWAERAGADFVGSTRGGDPAAVAFDAIAAAEARGRDVVIVDTAGRLHTQIGPDGGAREDPPRDRRDASTARRTRRCSSSTRPPARTACARRSSSARRSRSPASC